MQLYAPWLFFRASRKRGAARPELGPIAQPIGSITRPGVVLRSFNHSGPKRIEFDIALANQKVILRINHARFEAALPQGPAPSVRTVEVANILPAERLHHARYAIGCFRRNQEMNVIGHEDPGVDGDPALSGVFLEPIGVSREIFVGTEAYLTIVPTLDDMRGNAWQANPW